MSGESVTMAAAPSAEDSGVKPAGADAHAGGPLVPTGMTSVGKYRLIARIGSGGMAEVFLAVAKGPANFNKLIALKLTRSHLAEDPKLAEAFLEEARLSAQLRHKNIVQTYDIGEIDGRYFIAMEYLEGQAWSALHVGKKPVPLTLGLRVLVEALAALHYAHEFSDLDGITLGLVHRDVSPHNVFVTYEGQVKLLDFGIAKSLGREVTKTETGVLKGKIAYMAPEQVIGAMEIDRRADVFSAGVMLWEILAGQRLWGDANDFTIMMKLVNEPIRSPRTVVPNVPDELERICRKATATAPSERYATAAEFQADLEAYLESAGVKGGERELGQLVSFHFEEIRARTRELIREQQRLLRDVSDAADIPAASTSQPGEGSGSWRGRGFPDLLPALPTTSTSSQLGTVQPERALPPPRQWGKAAAILGVAAILSGGALAVGLSRSGGNVERQAVGAVPASAVEGVSSASAPPATKRVPMTLRVSTVPPAARISIDGKPVDANPLELATFTDGIEHTLRAEAMGYEPATEVTIFDGDRSVLLTLHRETGPAAQPVVRVGAAAPPVTHAPARAPARAPAAPPPASSPTSPVGTAPPPADPHPARRVVRPLDDDNPFTKR